MNHELKILPIYYEAILRGEKTFEVRKDDRPYKVGDTLVLKETAAHGFSGRESTVKVTYIIRDNNYVKDGFCIMGIKIIRGMIRPSEDDKQIMRKARTVLHELECKGTIVKHLDMEQIKAIRTGEYAIDELLKK